VSCPPDKHEKRAVIPYVHPIEKNSDGTPFEISGGPPRSDEEPAWCCVCGALWAKGPWGWSWRHPMSDRDAPTLANMLRDSLGKKREE